MEDILREIGEFIIQWCVYKVKEFFYESTSPSRRRRRRTLLRVAMAALALYALFGALMSLGPVNQGLVSEIYHEPAVVLVLVFGFVPGMAFVVGEYEHGSRVVGWSFFIAVICGTIAALVF